MHLNSHSATILFVFFLFYRFSFARDPVALYFWGADKAPATTAGVPNNLVTKGSPFINTYRTYYRLREEGSLRLFFWYRNIMDSQSEHALSAPANDSCSTFRIVAATVADGGITPNGSVVPGSIRPVKWKGIASRTVNRGESFWSDSTTITLPPGHYLAFTWTVEKLSPANAIPYAYQNQYSCFYHAGSAESQESNSNFFSTVDYAIAPNLVAYKKTIACVIGFLGNSIEQGFNASRDSYDFWVAQAAANLGSDVGVWNLGSGWGQARDAATNKAWLGKAKFCDEVVVCLGVNDLRNGATSKQVLGYLSTIVQSLLQISPKKKIIMCTVPPFNFTGVTEGYRRAINDTIRTHPPAGTSRVFDIAALLSQQSPHENLANPVYGDGHPNDSGGRMIGRTFASFYRDSSALPPEAVPVPASNSLALIIVTLCFLCIVAIGALPGRTRRKF